MARGARVSNSENGAVDRLASGGIGARAGDRETFQRERRKLVCFFARDRREVELYAAYLRNNGLVPIAQEYLPHDAGEYTVGVLSAQDAWVEGAIALKRSFHVKLSVAARGSDFLISSGYSQGHVDRYPEVTKTAIAIAQAVGSRGPINIQGRLDKERRFVPSRSIPASPPARTCARWRVSTKWIITCDSFLGWREGRRSKSDPAGTCEG